MRIPLAPVLALALLPQAACVETAPRTGWRIASVYDATGLVALADPGGTGAAGYTWRAPAGMVQTCGPSWAPLGLGITDAEAMASRLTPTLAVLLANEDAAAPPLDRRTAAVFVGTAAAPLRLEPALMPHALRIGVDGSAPEWQQSAVRQLLMTELCLEHKVGRAWIGGDGPDARQALLLREEVASDPGMYFIGGARPVPALLGPPDACISGEAPAAVSRPEGLDTQAVLQAGDIWNATLRPCGDAEDAAAPAGNEAMVSRAVPLRFGHEEATADPTWARWVDVAIDVSTTRTAADVTLGAGGAAAPAPDEALAWITARADGRLLFADEPLTRLGADGLVVTEVLSELPGTYPQAVTRPFPEEAESAFVLLLVPAWQLLPTAPGAVLPADPVADVLSDLSRLSVQVAAEGAEGAPSTGWTELNPYWDHPERVDWGAGYPFDGPLVESRVAGIGPTRLDGTLSAEAHRAHIQALLVAGFGLLVGLLGLSLGRVSDLWRRPPELPLEKWVEGPPDAEKDA